ncbi:hypothetical protein R3W88_012369 [Solanum pinnatisectum]|uniref:Uncharacterized protein n=1 Tax=Solanum pinnatisectum TaxID=50273 RepID=A0AAV9L8U4_9SOLN|nr:hypothetical protein R3W88_012369 [Solanum pinnatisectum]
MVASGRRRGRDRARHSWPEWTRADASSPVAPLEPEGADARCDNSRSLLIKKPKYVQISVESNSHLTGLEDQVKSLCGLEDEVKDLNEKFSTVQLEMTNNENLVKQHAKKAESEAATLKNYLESVTLLKLTAEDRITLGWCTECSHAADTSVCMVIQLSEKKSQAEAEIEMLKRNIESREREINSLKYELHINSKELEIRNEEKNMSVRSAEVANKQHLEGLEVESLGRDYRDSRVKKYQGRPSIVHKETKIWKEALSHRNSELQASRSFVQRRPASFRVWKHSCKQILDRKAHKSPPFDVSPSEGSFSHEANHLPRLPSMSEDRNDNNVSCASSWTTALGSDLSHVKKEKNMDDFLEMEKLAYQSSDTNRAVSSPDIPNNARRTTEVDNSMHVTTSQDSQLKEHNETSVSGDQASRNEELQSRISTVLESLSKEADIQRIQEDLREIVQEMRNTVIPQSTKSIVEITLSSRSHRPISLDDGESNLEKEIPVSEDSKSCNESIHGISKTLVDVMSQIHDFVLFLGKEAKAIQGTTPDGSGINEKLDDFWATYVEVISNMANVIFPNFFWCSTALDLWANTHEIQINLPNSPSSLSKHRPQLYQCSGKLPNSSPNIPNANSTLPKYPPELPSSTAKLPNQLISQISSLSSKYSKLSSNASSSTRQLRSPPS